MNFEINLEYTPRSPKTELPFTEISFFRIKSPYTFRTNEIGIALVDLWNLGWENSQSTIIELSFTNLENLIFKF